jgi:pyruvate dehydrogenase E2 component (dihydrolipoamide acetyltransferase)
VVEEVVLEEGRTAALGAVIARIRVEGGDGPPARAGANEAPAEPRADPGRARPEPTRAERDAASGRPRATPVARRLAQELGVDLERIEGSGPGGRIVEADVRAALPERSEPATSSGRGETTVVPHSATQRTIARRMAESRASIPEFTVEIEVRMDAAARLRSDLAAGHVEPVPSFNDLVVAAVSRALRDHPALNGGYEEGGAVRWSRVNVGVAVDVPDALLVPTIRDADRKSVFEIARESRRLSDRARSRTLAAEELSDGTFTVSNLGMLGARRFTAVINPPQAAILAVGEVAERPVAEDGLLVAGLTMEMSLSCDHRVVYGAEAARFLARVRDVLEHPALLFAEDSRG